MCNDSLNIYSYLKFCPTWKHHPYYILSAKNSLYCSKVGSDETHTCFEFQKLGTLGFYIQSPYFKQG